MQEAAALISAETGVKAAQPLAKEIAARVVAELLTEVDGVNADPFVAALQRVHASPFFALATCPEIDTISLFVEQRLERLRSRSGRYLTQNQQTEERQKICSELMERLGRRYARHLRL